MVSEAGSLDLPEEDGHREARPEVVRSGRRMAWLYAGAAVALLPWIAYLAITLPTRNLDRHYRAAWVGFDLLLVFAIVRTAYMAFRIDPRVQFPAIVTATLLLVDAWFDVTTSSGRGATLEALLLAGLAEIPAALFSLYLARRVSRQVLHLAHLDEVSPGGPGPNRKRRPGYGDAAGPGV